MEGTFAGPGEPGFSPRHRARLGGARRTRRHREESRAMRNAKWMVIVIAIVALALGAGAVQGQQPPSGEYKIGVLEPLTGNLAVQGRLHLEGYEIMRDLINSRFGGVMGKKLVLATGDAVDPTAAAPEATRLAARAGVRIITGTVSS